MLRVLAMSVLPLFSVGVSAQDPIKTDGDKYRILLENERVRVLEYHDSPGDKTHQHDHPAFVLYAVTPFTRKLVLPGGKVIVRVFKAGDVLYSDAQTHIGENIGQTPTHGLIVELKPQANRGQKQPDAP